MKKRNGRRVWKVLAFTALVGIGAVAVVWARRRRPHLPAAPQERVRPTHPVLIVNPLSGDGKAKRFDVAGAAARLGVETVTFEKGDSFETLAHDAVDRGCDLLMVGGGDGSLAAVATVAMERDVRFACVPIGTRNHFAMDLGLDRDDPVKALDAAVDAVEVDVNVGRVNGRVFLNNVSFGVYAQALSDADYREHRAKNLLEATAQSEGGGSGFAVQTPSGETRDEISVLLISNNPYESIGPPDHAGRAALDTGTLGVMLAGRQETDRHRHHDVERWTTPRSTVTSTAATVPAGVDGELVTFDAPVDLDASSVLRVLLPTRLVEREFKGSTATLAEEAWAHLTGVGGATPVAD
jgi:diacylglycerol kinase family enzyme